MKHQLLKSISDAIYSCAPIIIITILIILVSCKTEKEAILKTEIKVLKSFPKPTYFNSGRDEDKRR